jgi:hypothetical protein
MSASDGNQANSHEGDHAEAHDHGPPAPPEPNTPMWLPAVGALLFLTAGLAWALSTPPKETADLSAIPAGSASAAPTTNSAPAPAATHPAPAATPAAPNLLPSGQPRAIGTTVVQPLPGGDKRRR